MKTTVEPLEGNKVKLSVEVDEGEFSDAIDAAFRKIARQVKIPGFRPGKAPRQIIEARVGLDAARQEALSDSLPDFYERALRENDIEPIAAPDIDITSGKESGPVIFDAVVEIMPTVSVAGYQGLKVVLPGFNVTEEQIDGKLDMMRDKFAELVPVSRPARDGDHVSMDRSLTRHGETLHRVEDELYEVGSGTGGPDLDENLRGARAGDILKFNVEHPDPEMGEVTFHVLVKEVKEKVLPEVTDEWALEAWELDSVEELRKDIRYQLDAVRKVENAFVMRGRVVEALVELVDEDPPEALVALELDRRLRSLIQRVTKQGLDLGAWLQATGRTQEDVILELRNDSVAAAKLDLALRAMAELENVEVGDDEVEAEIARLAEKTGKKPAAMRRELDGAGQLPAVRSDLRKSKALEWLIGQTEYVDEEGQPVDRSYLFPPEAEPDAEAADASQETPGAYETETIEAP
ncbi:MAG: trigger factor [Actinomycetota bacterium]|nr:trigger factor [Actinomycetota bacterium]